MGMSRAGKEGGGVYGDWSECGLMNEWLFVAVSQMTTYCG